MIQLNVVLLKLLLEGKQAKEEAEDVEKKMDSLGDKAKKAAKAAAGAVRSVVSGLSGIVRDNVGVIFNKELPAQLAGAQLSQNVSVAVAKGLGGPLGDAPALAVNQAFESSKGGGHAGMKGAWATVQQIQSVFPETKMAAEDIGAIGRAAFDQHKNVYEVNRHLRERFQEQLPSDDFPIHEKDALKKNLKQAQATVMEGVSQTGAIASSSAKLAFDTIKKAAMGE